MDYAINIHQLAHATLSPEKQTDLEVATLAGGLVGFDRQWSEFLANKLGADMQYGAAAWAAGAYAVSDVVIYFPTGEAYVCETATSAEPTTSSDWRKIAECFIGFDEMQHFDGTTLSLTFALNRRFMTTYVDPPSTSDIYLESTPLPVNVFYVGSDEPTSSSVAPSTSSEFVMSAYTITPATAFDIKVPTAVMTALGSEAEKAIRKFVDKYVTMSLNYTITPY